MSLEAKKLAELVAVYSRLTTLIEAPDFAGREIKAYRRALVDSLEILGLPEDREIEHARAVLARDFRTYGRDAAVGAWRDADTNPAIAYELGRRDGARSSG